jgi:hypothetical protein
MRFKSSSLDIDFSFLIQLQKVLQCPPMIPMPMRDNDGINLSKVNTLLFCVLKERVVRT